MESISILKQKTSIFLRYTQIPPTEDTDKLDQCGYWHRHKKRKIIFFIYINNLGKLFCALVLVTLN